MDKFYSAIVRLNSLQFKYRTIISFVTVLLILIGIDFGFHYFFSSIADYFNHKVSIDLTNPETIALDFAPEIWGGVLAMVLGTLIIVIAIAAESSPKLMDLFVKDWLSLLYVWFLILASLHAVLIMFYVEPLNRVSSVVLNTYIYLKCNPTVNVERISKRSRNGESGIPLEYLEQLNNKHEEWMAIENSKDL